MSNQILKFNNFINESNTDKGKKIIYSFKTKAYSKESPHGDIYTHNVQLTQGKPIGNDMFNGIVLSIQNTPGSWYLDTLYNFHNPSSTEYDTMSIYGNWICTNWSDIMDELKDYVSKNFKK